MKFIKPYQEYLINLFLKNLIIVTLNFASLSFILNILKKLNFLKISIGILLSYNIHSPKPASILFEIFHL